jgi:hypothetical protein
MDPNNDRVQTVRGGAYLVGKLAAFGLFAISLVAGWQLTLLSMTAVVTLLKAVGLVDIGNGLPAAIVSLGAFPLSLSVLAWFFFSRVRRLGHGASWKKAIAFGLAMGTSIVVATIPAAMVVCYVLALLGMGNGIGEENRTGMILTR